MKHPIPAFARAAAAFALFAPLLQLGACSAPERKGPPEKAGRMVPTAELPPEYREAALAWKDDGPEWRAIRERALEDRGLADFIVYNLIDVMVDAYGTARIARAGELAGPFERARRDLVYLSAASAPVLVELIEVGDGVVSFLAADTLQAMRSPALAPLVAAKLARPERETRRRAAELLGHLPDARAHEGEVQQALERALLDDPEWTVRAQAALAIGRRARHASDAAPARRSLSLALADPDPAVVEAAARGLATLGDLRAVPALIDALERHAASSDSRRAIQALQGALRQLTGESRSHDPAGWRAWLRRAGGKSP